MHMEQVIVGNLRLMTDHTQIYLWLDSNKSTDVFSASVQGFGKALWRVYLWPRALAQAVSNRPC